MYTVIDQIGCVTLGARVTKVTVPAKAPNALESTGIENVVALIGVAVNDPLTAVQLPVPPLIVTVGRVAGEYENPWPALTVKTTAAALVADAIDIGGDVGCIDGALQSATIFVPSFIIT